MSTPDPAPPPPALPTPPPNPQALVYGGDVWNDSPVMQLIQGRMSSGDFMRLGDRGTNVWSLAGGPDGTAPYIPPPSQMNYNTFAAARANPDAWAYLSSIYNAGNRNLEAEWAMMDALRPYGNAAYTNTVRTF